MAEDLQRHDEPNTLEWKDLRRVDRRLVLPNRPSFSSSTPISSPLRDGTDPAERGHMATPQQAGREP